MAKAVSRVNRWNEATAQAREAYAQLESALSDLIDIQSEYEEWKDNLPESLSNSAVAEKLENICNLDITSVQDNLSELLDELEGAELPLGFGRD